MSKHRFIVLIMACLLSGPVLAKDAVALKSVKLNDFMVGDLVKVFPISLLVPESYEPVEFDEDPGKYYWMRPKDVKKVIKSQKLPTRKGYMYGTISLNVGYDMNEDLFIGLEEPEVQYQYRNHFEIYTLERTAINGYPVALMSLREKGSDHNTYLMYIGLKIETNAVLIAYVPPKYSGEKGDFVWGAQMAHFSGEVSESDSQ